MFILKKEHQPGVYVPLRALFLVLKHLSPLKLLGQSMPNSMWSFFLEVGGQKFKLLVWVI